MPFVCNARLLPASFFSSALSSSPSRHNEGPITLFLDFMSILLFHLLETFVYDCILVKIYCFHKSAGGMKTQPNCRSRALFDHFVGAITSRRSRRQAAESAGGRGEEELALDMAVAFPERPQQRRNHCAGDCASVDTTTGSRRCTHGVVEDVRAGGALSAHGIVLVNAATRGQRSHSSCCCPITKGG